MPLKIVPDNTNIGFVRVRFIAFALTLLLTIGSIGLLATRGLNLGVDFIGGLTMEVEFKAPPPLDALRAKVDSLGVGTSALQEFGNPKNILIRLPLPEGDQAAVQKVVAKVQAGLKGNYGDVNFRRVESVSGKVSGELIQSGIWAVLLSMAAVALFTWFRFEWFFGISTVVALVHDVIVTLGFFALTQLEFDLNVVAAVPAAKELQSSLAQGAVAAAEAQKFETVARGRAAALQASGTAWTRCVVARVAHTVARLAFARGNAG